jgi:hypothetical protein
MSERDAQNELGDFVSNTLLAEIRFADQAWVLCQAIGDHAGEINAFEFGLGPLFGRLQDFLKSEFLSSLAKEVVAVVGTAYLGRQLLGSEDPDYDAQQLREALRRLLRRAGVIAS